MDPQTCLYNALDAIADRDREAAAEHLESLAEWINRGGFLPQVFDDEGAHLVYERRVGPRTMAED